MMAPHFRGYAATASCCASLMSNIEILEREGVRPAQLHEHVAKRLSTTPGFLETFYGRLVGERSDAAYRANPTITLATVYDWWASRVPYYEKRGIPTDWPRHMMRLCLWSKMTTKRSV